MDSYDSFADISCALPPAERTPLADWHAAMAQHGLDVMPERLPLRFLMDTKSSSRAKAAPAAQATRTHGPPTAAPQWKPFYTDKVRPLLDTMTSTFQALSDGIVGPTGGWLHGADPDCVEYTALAASSIPAYLSPLINDLRDSMKMTALRSEVTLISSHSSCPCEP